MADLDRRWSSDWFQEICHGVVNNHKQEMLKYSFFEDVFVICWAFDVLFYERL